MPRDMFTTELRMLRMKEFEKIMVGPEEMQGDEHNTRIILFLGSERGGDDDDDDGRWPGSLAGAGGFVKATSSKTNVQ
jgi:hypothetical protein